MGTGRRDARDIAVLVPVKQGHVTLRANREGTSRLDTEPAGRGSQSLPDATKRAFMHLRGGCRSHRMPGRMGLWARLGNNKGLPVHIAEWMVVMSRWGLAVDPAERATYRLAR